jgi:hypothetical protein
VRHGLARKCAPFLAKPSSCDEPQRRASITLRTPASHKWVGYGHKRVNHSRDEFARQDGTHINGIEGFWALAKVRLARFRGMAPQTFWLHLKECELTTGGRTLDGWCSKFAA